MTITVRRIVGHDTLGAYSSKVEIEADDSTKTVKVFVDDDYTAPVIEGSRKEFLDLIVACWPDNVAYQFNDEDDDEDDED